MAAFQGRDGMAIMDPRLGKCAVADQSQIDAIVVSVNQHGFFAEAGPLRIFVSSHVRIL